MKLHLPKSLRKAVLACCFAAVGITTTVGTASIHGGMASFILTAQAAAEEMTGIIISSSGDARLTSTPAGEQIIMQLDRGYLAGSQHTGFDVLADILIKVLRINDGNSYATYNFKGDITGDGVFERTSGAKSNNQTYVFTGDMSGYTGDMNLSKENDNSTIKFVGNQSGTGTVSIAAGNTLVVDGATMNNSSITSSGTMNVLHNATFNGAVSVNGSLNLGAGAGITNNGSFTFGDQSFIDFSNLTAVRNENRQIVYSLFTAGSAGSSNFNTLSQSNVTGLHAAGSDWVFGADGSLTGTLHNNELHYTGGSLVWNNRDASFISPSGGASAFTAYDDVIFSGTTSATMAENVHAMRITVAEQGVLTINAAASGTLKADEVVVLGTLKLNKGGQNGSFTGGIDVHGRLELTTGDVTGWSDSHGIKCINILAGGEMHVGVGGNQKNQTGAGLSINLQGGSITGVNEANFDLAYGGATYGYSSITALAAEDATPESPTLSSISGCGITLRQNATTIQVAEHARLDISSAIMQKSDYLNSEGAVPAGMNAGLTKTGAGELRLSGASTYTQATTVEEGTLTLLGGASLASPSITLKNDSLLQLDTLAGTHVALSGVLSGEGSILKQGSGSAAIAGGLADSFVGTIAVQGGSLRLGESLAINSGRELSLGTCGAVLDSDLSLAAGGRLRMDYSGTGPVTSLNQHTLTLSGDTELNLCGLVDPYGRTITLLTGISDILDSSGSSLSQDSSNKPLSDFFTISNPGLSYLENAALSFSDGNLQLLVSRRPVTTITERQTSGLVYERYQGICFENIASYSDGGAIYGGYDSTITISDNGSVVFEGNSASSYYDYAYGGAIYAVGDINIRNNGSVLFEKNVENSGGNYYLRCIYAGGTGNEISLSVAEDKIIEFRDSIYIASGNTVSLNADYVDETGVTHKQAGDVILTGAYTEQHLNELLANTEAGRIPNWWDLLVSQTSEVNTLTHLYGGRLRVEEGAIYQGQGITVHEGSAATVRVQNAELNHAGYDLTFHSGTTLELAGNNSLSGNLHLMDGSALIFDLSNGAGVTDIYGQMEWGENVTLLLSSSGCDAADNTVLIYVEQEDSSLKGQSVLLPGGDTLTWVDNLLVLNYNADSFNHYFNETRLCNETLLGNVRLNHYESLALAGINSLSYGGAIYGNYITLSNNGSVVFEGNSASSDYYDRCGGAIYGATITLNNNGSVVFEGNSASSDDDAYGGAICGNDITLSNNGSVVFEGNSASSDDYYAYGGAICGNDITLSNNGSVVFEGNSASSDDYYAYGGAIYGATITLNNNGSVVFEGNTVSYDDYAYGGAICGDSNSTITLNNNGSVVFEGNTVSSYYDAYGGAIYGDSNSTITLNNNGSVVFEGNTVSAYDNYAYGGAICGRSDSTITLNYNESVSFTANTVSSRYDSHGGAIYGGNDSTITLSNNGSVVFDGNTASYTSSATYFSFSYGGAIYGGSNSIITLSNNGSVVFEGNSASSDDYYACGGAICADGDINIRNNDSVLFEKNTEIREGAYCLRSIYAGGTGNEISLSVAEDKIIEFRDSIYIKTGSMVSLNADYVDETGMTHKQEGDIIFTGAYTEQHLNELKAGRIAASSEIFHSRMSEVYALTHLYGGRLRVEEGAIYKGHGVTVHEGTSATVRVQNAELNHAGYDLTFHSGTSLELAGNNSLSGNLHLMDGSALIFDLSNGAGVTDIYGQMEWGENVTLLLSSAGSDTADNTVLIYVEQEDSSLKGQSVLLPEGDTLTWVDNLLVLNYNADSFNHYFNGTRLCNETLLGNVRLHHYESLALADINRSSSGGAIYGDSNSTVTLSNNDSVVFERNSVTTSSALYYTSASYAYSYGGAIYVDSNSTVTMGNNGSVVFERNSATTSSAADRAYSYGGAIYGDSNSTVTLRNNGSVVFEGNAATTSSARYSTDPYSCSYSYGGAIYGSTITLNNNGSVVFDGNAATTSTTSSRTACSYGGAIYGSTITLNNNGSVVFEGNAATTTSSSDSASSYGGAIRGSTITLNYNDSVSFIANTVSSRYDSYGGAISALGDINIRNNSSVLFEKNAENSSGTYRLRSIYAGGTGNEISLSVAEDKNIEFRDSIYIASRNTVSLNADYVDETGVTHKQAGDIIFTGAYTELHLNELLAAEGAGRTATSSEILNSRTSEVYALTHLYGGRLRVEEGAIYKGYGITVHENSNAAVRVQNAELNHAGHGISFHAGTVLELVGSNILTGNLNLHQDSTLSFDIDDFTEKSTLTGTLIIADGLRLCVNVDASGVSGIDASEYDMVLLDATGADCEIGHWILESISVITSGSWGYKECVEWLDGKLIIPLKKQADTVTWTNAAGDFKWNGVSQNWSEGDFRFGGVNGAHVILGNTAAGTLELSGDIQLQSLKVTDNSAYELYFEKGASLSMSGELNVDEGSSLIVGNSMHAGSVANDGYLELHGGLTVQGAVQSTGLLSLEGALAAASLQSLGIAVDSLTLSDVDATNTVYGDLTVSGDVTVAGNLETTGNLSGADISVAGILTATNVSADSLMLIGEDASHTVDGDILVSGNVTVAGSLAASGKLSGTDISVAGALSAANVSADTLILNNADATHTVDGDVSVRGDVTVAGSLETTGTLSGADISVAGILSAANVSADSLMLTGADATHTVDGDVFVSGKVTVAGSLAASGNLRGADISVAGALSAANVSADNMSAASLQAASLEAAALELTKASVVNTVDGDILVRGDVIVAGSLETAGNISASEISVAGALSASNVSVDNLRAASLQAASLEAATLELTKASVVNTVNGDILVRGDVSVAGSLETAGNMRASDISVAGALSASNVSVGNLRAASLQAASLEAASLELTKSAEVNTVVGNIIISGNVFVAGSLETGGNLHASDISVAGALSALNVSVDNLRAASLQAASLEAAALELTKASVVNTVDCDLTVNGDVTVAGSLVTAGNLHASDISVAGVLSAVNVSADSLTLTGADATHTVEGDILVSGNVTVAGSLESAGTLSGADISVAGALHAATVSADSLMLTGADATHTINGDVTVSGGVSVAGSLETAGNLHASDISVAGALSAVNVSADSLTLTGADATHTVNGDVSVNGDVTAAGSLATTGNLSGADISVSGTLSAANLSAYSLELTHAGATNAVRGDLDVSTDVTVAGSLNVAGAARAAGAVKTGGVFSAALVQTTSLSAGSLQLTDAAGKSTIGGAVVLDGNAVVAGSLAALGEFSAQDVRIGGDLTVSSLQVNTVHADGTISITGDGMYNSVTEDLYADSVGLATGAVLAVGQTLTAGEISFTGTAYTINAGALGKDCMNFELDRAALESLGLGYKQTGTIAQVDSALAPGFVATLNGGTEAVAAAAYQYSISTSGSSVQLTADYAHDGLQVWYRGDWVGKSSWTDYYIAGYDAVNGVEQVDLNGQYVYGANLYVAYEDGVSAAVVSNGSLQFEYVDLGGGQLEIASDAAVTTNELYGKGETLVLHDGARLEATELTLGTLVLHDSGVTVKKATINTVGGTEGSLTIEARGSVTVKSDMTLTGLTNEGSLNMGKKNLTVNALVDVGGNVTAGEVSVQSRGSRMAEFDKLVADKVTVVNNVTTGRYTDDLSVGNGSAIGELVAETLEVREGTVTLGRTSGSTEMSLHYLDLQEDATLVLNRQTSLAVTKELTATENATVQLKQHASLDYDGVNISNRKESGTLSVNAYALSGETDLELNGAHVAATGSGDKMIDYKLVNSTVENAGSGTLQVTHRENSLAGIAASGGDVEVYNVSAPMNLQELHIAMGLNVSLMLGDVGSSMTPENEADVTVVGMAVFEQGATLNANLTLAAGSELRMDGPLHMGSSLELVAGEGTITLSGAMYDAVSSLELGESLTLFTGVDSLTLTNDSISVTYRPGELHSARADRYFGNLPVPGEERYYYITYTHTDECGGAVAITLNVPEPATSTLSLLALAALATRRRRK